MFYSPAIDVKVIRKVQEKNNLQLVIIHINKFFYTKPSKFSDGIIKSDDGKYYGICILLHGLKHK